LREENNLPLFKIETLAFVFSMFFFIIAEDPVSILIGFDLLGITSFLLILFFKRQRVIRRATTTLMMNKVGDLFAI
jgi:NADH-ubiquinone oxidoreductase chain 5